MTDHYAVCETALATLLKTMTNEEDEPYFPPITGREQGWQVTNDDTVLATGSDYYIVYRAGAHIPPERVGSGFVNFEHHVSAVLFHRFTEYASAWDDWNTFRAAVGDLLDNNRGLGGGSGVYDVRVVANEPAGRLTDRDGSELNFIAQAADIVIYQRARLAVRF